MRRVVRGVVSRVVSVCVVVVVVAVVVVVVVVVGGSKWCAAERVGYRGRCSLECLEQHRPPSRVLLARGCPAEAGLDDESGGALHLARVRVKSSGRGGGQGWGAGVGPAWRGVMITR